MVKQCIIDFIYNKMIISALASWAVAQLIKTIIHACVNKSVQLERLHGDGGMPSGHSATVVALATSAALTCGLGSPEFAIAGILAIIVMHDATGVRQESGKHAKAINELMVLLAPDSDLTPEEQMKELLGHTPLQVFCGGCIGLLIAFLICR